MTYSVSQSFQRALYEQLANDSALNALVGDAIFDAVPPGPVQGTYVVIGDEEVRDWSNQTNDGTELRFTVSVISDAQGFETAKSAGAAVCDAVIDAPLSLTRGNLVLTRFLRARARRVRSGQTRRIDLIFRSLVEDA